MPRRSKKKRSYGSGSYWQRPSGRWRGRVWVGGAPRQATFDKEQDVKDWLDLQGAERVARITGSIATRGFRPDVTLAELGEEFLADRKRAGRTAETLRGYRSDLGVVLGTWSDLRVADVDGPQLEALLEAMMKTGWSASTVRNRINLVCGMARYAMRRGYVPARALPLERPRVTIATRPATHSDDEVGALLEAAQTLDDKDGEGPVQLARILLGVDAGLRLAEILRARAEDLEARHLTLAVPVREAGDEPKSHRGRVVPITRRLARALRALRRPPGERLVADAAWKATTPLYERMRDVWAVAGVDGGKQPVHRLRHTWATRYVEGGGTLAELMAHGGWTSLAACRRYLHEPEAIRRAPVEALEARGRKSAKTAPELLPRRQRGSKKA